MGRTSVPGLTGSWRVRWDVTVADGRPAGRPVGWGGVQIRTVVGVVSSSRLVGCGMGGRIGCRVGDYGGTDSW